MKKINKKLSIFLFLCLLFIISFGIVLMNARTYTFDYEIDSKINNVNEVKIKYDKKIIKIDSIKLKKGNLKVNISSIKKGFTDISVDDFHGNTYYKLISVHSFGIITVDGFFGDFKGDIVIPILIIIILTYVLYAVLKLFKKSMKINLYQYKNVAYLGLIVFISFAIVFQFFSLVDYNGLQDTIVDIISVSSGLSFFLLPLAFVTSILVTISNIKLVIKEGMSIKNALGIILGLFLCLMTFLPIIISDFFQNTTFVDVHNENGIWNYVDIFLETSIYITVAYLECILIATIIIGIKSALHIPKYNKDYIIILGCRIKKDGTLTPLLKSRVDRALKFRNIQKNNNGKDLKFVVSGGKGNDEVISEAEAMKRYLLLNGISEKDILIENKSKNTYENIKFSNNLIKKESKNCNIAFSTTNYHVFRAGLIAYLQGVNIEGIGSNTKSYFFINAFIREYIGTLYSEKKRHIIIVIVIEIILLIAIYIKYLSVIL